MSKQLRTRRAKLHKSPHCFPRSLNQLRNRAVIFLHNSWGRIYRMAWNIAVRQPGHVASEVPASHMETEDQQRPRIGYSDNLHPKQPISGTDIMCVYTENISYSRLLPQQQFSQWHLRHSNVIWSYSFQCLYCLFLLPPFWPKAIFELDLLSVSPVRKKPFIFLAFGIMMESRHYPLFFV